MKKISALLVILFMFYVNSANSAVVSPVVDGEFQEYINKTGFKILNSNEIEQNFVFRYSNSNALKTNSSFDKNIIYIPKGLLTFVESEDELAALIAYRIAFNQHFKEDSAPSLSVKLSPKKYETYADKRAVDLLIKAGYSPIALIAMINKVDAQSKINLNKEKKSVRLAKIYEYLLRKYPDKLEDKNFKNNIYYQNFLLNSRQNRENLQNRMKYDPYSTKRIEYR